jgi:hypothetical protein
MVKKISVDELTWLVTNALQKANPSGQSRIAVAIVPDKTHGWRVVVANRSRARVSTTLRQELVKVEKQLKRVYRPDF